LSSFEEENYCGNVTTGERGDQQALTREVLDLVMALMRSMQGSFERRVGASGVPAPEVMTLWQLREIGEMPMRGVADCMHLDPSQVTALVDRLEARGYAERRPHLQDRRVKLVGLTPGGERFLDELLAGLHDDVPPLAALGTDDLVALRDILRRSGLATGPAAGGSAAS
jgi:DNA-binding MarR family transcriptional regulator